MKFRFKVQNPDNNINPNSFLCGTTFTDTALASYGLYIEVNGTVITDTAIGILNSTSHTVTPVVVGGLTVDFHIENLVYVKLDITGLTRDQSANLRIKITSNDHSTYDNTFKIFGFDMGNNPSISYPSGMASYTKPINIKLIPKNWLLPTPSTKYVPCASAYVYRDFVSGKIYIMKNNSSIGTTTYKLSGTNITLGVGDYVEIDDFNNDISSIEMAVVNNEGSSFTTLTVPSAPITEPILGYSYTNAGCNGCLCFKANTVVTLTANVGAVESYLIDDLLVDPTFVTINYNIELINPLTGVVIDNINFGNSPNPSLTVLTNTYTPSVDIDETIDYQLRYTLRSINISGAIIAQETFNLEACSKSELTKVDCNIYEWVNKTGVVDIVLKQMNSLGVLTTIESYTAVPLNTKKIFTLNDGVYVLTVSQGETVNFSYKLVSMCTFINCLAKYTEEIACSDPCDDNKEDCGCADCSNKKEDLEIFNLLAMAYLAALNKMYLENPIYYILDTESASTLQDLALIQDRLSKYCSGCN